mmetsp:Transcript_61887/g.146643  ORF Transcript_61887/g.146643 Transcript_61887/m.146643 type:complete len:217 (-) Transcript_61887:3768-4418(-)
MVVGEHACDRVRQRGHDRPWRRRQAQSRGWRKRPISQRRLSHHGPTRRHSGAAPRDDPPSDPSRRAVGHRRVRHGGTASLCLLPAGANIHVVVYHLARALCQPVVDHRTRGARARIVAARERGVHSGGGGDVLPRGTLPARHGGHHPQRLAPSAALNGPPATPLHHRQDHLSQFSGAVLSVRTAGLARHDLDSSGPGRNLGARRVGVHPQDQPWDS